MKYIITNKHQVRVGPDTAHHKDLAKDTDGWVNRAGRYTVEGGKVRVYGKSYGFNIEADPKDAKAIQRALPALKAMR